MSERQPISDPEPIIQPQPSVKAKGKERERETAKARSTQHEWKFTDPLQFSPRSYNRGVFKINYPLVQVLKGEENIPSFNKFGKMRMDPQARKVVIAACAREIHKSIDLFGDHDKEMRASDFHRSIFRSLRGFTLPSNAKATQCILNDQILENTIGRKRKRIEDEISSIKDLANQTDIEIEDADGRKSADSEFNVSIQGKPEVNDEDELGRGNGDLLFHVYSKRRKTCDMLDDRKLVAVVEENSNNDSNATYEGANYAGQEMVKNIINEHRSPVYIISMTLSGSWTYSILRSRGFVKIKNGMLDGEEIFRKQEQMMGFADPIGWDVLKARLQERLQYYRTNFADHPNPLALQYSDGNYLVGDLYVSGTWRMLPKGQFSCGGSDVHMFYDGIMRIIVGEQITKWDKETIMKVHKVREHMDDIGQVVLDPTSAIHFGL